MPREVELVKEVRVTTIEPDESQSLVFVKFQRNARTLTIRVNDTELTLMTTLDSSECAFVTISNSVVWVKIYGKDGKLKRLFTAQPSLIKCDFK